MTDLHYTEYKRREEWMHNAALSDITGHAESIAFNAGRITASPFRLAYQEPFRTRMEAALELAVKELEEAQAICNRKLAEYRKLAVRDAA